MVEKIKTWFFCAAKIITNKWVTISGILLMFTGTIIVSSPNLVNWHKPAAAVMLIVYAQMAVVAITK